MSGFIFFLDELEEEVKKAEVEKKKFSELFSIAECAAARILFLRSRVDGWSQKDEDFFIKRYQEMYPLTPSTSLTPSIPTISDVTELQMHMDKQYWERREAEADAKERG